MIHQFFMRLFYLLDPPIIGNLRPYLPHPCRENVVFQVAINAILNNNGGRREPLSEGEKECSGFELTVTPTSEVSNYVSGENGRKHWANILHKTMAQGHLAPTRYAIRIGPIDLD